jgi:hypothetical protein
MSYMPRSSTPDLGLVRLLNARQLGGFRDLFLIVAEQVLTLQWPSQDFFWVIRDETIKAEAQPVDLLPEEFYVDVQRHHYIFSRSRWRPDRLLFAVHMLAK